MRVRKYEPFDWYDTPLYYDIVFEEETETEGAFLELMRERFGTGHGKRVLEPACGSGRLVLEMARRGWKVTGFDLNPQMVKFTKERLAKEGLKARLLEADMSDFDLPARHDLAHCLVSTFKYLLDEESARRHLESVARALVPGGLYVLGFHLTDYEHERMSHERWVGRRGGVHVTCNIRSWPPDLKRRIEKVRSRLVVDEKGTTRGYETTWDFRTYDAAQFNRLLRKVPELEHVATYDFCYQLGRRREFDDQQLDNVLILRRRRDA